MLSVGMHGTKRSQSGLGEEYLKMFYACVSEREISKNPLLYPKVYSEFRRRLLRRFPYAIYFIIKR